MTAMAALEQLVRRYWPAVYAYIRSSGCSVDEAADLTQGFVCDVVLERRLFSHADPKRGRFRSLLLKAVSNYVEQCRRRDRASKRSPPSKPLSLSKMELASMESANNLPPEQAFCAQWNATIIRRVLDRVAKDCNSAGLTAHWEVFEARVVRPMLMGEPRLAYSKIVERLELSDAGQAANMMITVKRRFVQALIQEVAATVSDPLEVEDEMRAMLRDLERQP